MKGFTFLFDVGGLAFDDRDANDPFVYGDWFQLAKSGTFFSPVYGKVTISEQDLRTMHRNFKEITPVAPTELPIDYDHKSDAPELHAAGEAKAAGWVQDLELRENATELWCRPKWTRKAATSIAAGEYRFVSPFFVTNFLDKLSGKRIGPTLRAVAITNRPFLEGMQEIPAPAIAASDTAVDMFSEDKRVAVQVRRTAVSSKRLAQRGIAMAKKDDEEEVVEKEEEEDDSEDLEDSGEEDMGLACPQCGAPVSHDGSHMGKTKEAKEAAGMKKTIDGVKKMLDEGGGDAKKGEKKMSDQTVEDRLAALEKANADLTAKLTAQVESNRQLSEKNTTTEAALKALQDRESRSEAQSLIDEALEAGKITPALVGEKDKPGWARAFAERDPQGFRTWMAQAPVIVAFEERGTSQEKAADGAAGTASKINDLVGVAMSETKGMTYAEATKKVLAGNPDLARTYDEEMIGDRSPASAARISGIRRL